ncbi:DUF4003 domain-containing protein [Christensenellaceae bacterium OttesenSCG-928-K19]|nr:DUF4003 domain-containing protein [Christensenellaceae bacterium OttesenSCG-928-K19]
MEQTLTERCEQFIENKAALRSAFKLEHASMHALCAIIYGSKKVDVKKIKDCKKIIRKQTSIFSSFRSNTFLALATMLSLEEDPAARMEDILDTYTVFKKNKFWGSDFLALSSFLIKEVGHREKEQLVEKAREIYKLAKESHPILTSSKDYGYAVMMALSDMNARDAVIETDRCYELLKGEFVSKNSVQSLSFVLALGEDKAEEKCAKTMRLFETLKKNGYKYGMGYELPGLGVLALAAMDEEKTIADVMAVSDYLKTQKGFGALGLGRAQRILYASALTVQETVGMDETLSATLTTTVANILIAIEIALIAAISASSAAAAASSSNN